MPYVMIPVPEEHVEDVMQFVLRAIARAAIEPWDAESINALYNDVDEASRSLLAFVARSAVEGGELTDADAARSIQMTIREAAGILNEFNTLTRETNRPPLINVRVVSERLPNGRVTDRRVLQMESDVAEFIAAAEQAELRDVANPLGGATQ